MIVLAAVLLISPAINAGEYFPLVAGTRWVYEDSASPGMEDEEVVKSEVDPNITPDNFAVVGGVKLKPFFPVQRSVNGQPIGAPCYRVSGDTLFLVGYALNKPIAERPILKVGLGKVDWEYYADPSSALEPDPVLVVAHSQPGPSSTYFGKNRKTVIVHSLATVGGKNGLAVNQTATYAEGVGLVSFVEDGKAGNQPIRHTRKLVQFEAGRVGAN